MSAEASFVLRQTRRVGGALGTLLLAVLAAFTIATATGWLAVTPVLSGSMRPGFNPGDAMLTERVAATSLHVGDIVNVKVPPNAGGGQRVHRIVAIRHEGTDIAIQTKGDANTVTDSGWIVLKGDQYRTLARLPYVGWIVDFRAANGAEILFGAIAFVGALSILQRLRLRRRSHLIVPDGASPSGVLAPPAG
jgi:signal peptidase